MNIVQTIRFNDLVTARLNWYAAKAAMAAATTKKAERTAAEDVEFWGSKVAYLASWIAKGEG